MCALTTRLASPPPTQVRGARQTTTDPAGFYGVFRSGMMRVGRKALWGSVGPELIVWLLLYYAM